MYEKFTSAAIQEASKVGVGDGDDKTGSPLVLIITALIPVVADLIIGCFNKAERAAAEARRPGVISRWRLRREIREQIPGNDRDSDQVRDVVFNAVLAAGKHATAEDFVKLGLAA